MEGSLEASSCQKMRQYVWWLYCQITPGLLEVSENNLFFIIICTVGVCQFGYIIGDIGTKTLQVQLIHLHEVVSLTYRVQG
jgi:hypothetical protein